MKLEGEDVAYSGLDDLTVRLIRLGREVTIVGNSEEVDRILKDVGRQEYGEYRDNHEELGTLLGPGNTKISIVERS